MEGGKEFAAAFVDEGYHVAVVVGGEGSDGATHFGADVLAGGCLARVAVEWGAGMFSYKTSGAREVGGGT